MMDTSQANESNQQPLKKNYILKFIWSYHEASAVTVPQHKFSSSDVLFCLGFFSEQN